MVDYVHHYGGDPKVSTQGMKEARTAASTILGTCKPLQQGREIIYCFVTAAITGNGIVYGTKPNQANHSNQPVAVTASIGDTEVTICAGATAIAKDEYKDGFLLVNDAAGEGHAYMIQGHASASSGSGIKVYLKDGVEVALTTASEVTLCYNKGYVIPIGNLSSTVTAVPCGVSLITAAASRYVWMGKKGPWPCVGGATPVCGEDCYISSAGVSELLTGATTFHRVGRFLTTAAATEFVMVDVDL